MAYLLLLRMVTFNSEFLIGVFKETLRLLAAPQARQLGCHQKTYYWSLTEGLDVW